MSIRLFFSNRLEALADRLGEELLAEGREGDPFAAGTVIVPNPNVKTWLQLHLARRHGVAMNVRFPFLERGLWECLTELAGDRHGALRALDRDLLQAMILGVLTGEPDALPAAAELAPLISYLREPDGSPRPNYARRAWQLAGRLAALFVEYGFQRGDMIRAWRQGRLSKEANKASPGDTRMETCQMRLYRLLLGEGGWRDRRDVALGGRTLTLPECADLVLDAACPPATAARPLHLFGLSQISAFHRDLLLRLAPWRPCRLYQFNVCAEYWEDITTPSEDRWWERIRDARVTTTSAGQELDCPAPDNPLLKAWGKPGRESLKMLSELETRAAGVTPFEQDWIEGELPDRRTVLGLLQSQVLTRSSEPAPPGLRQDRSLQIVGCPGIFREVETVHASIVDNLQRTPDLRLTEIAVMVPDMATYQPVIQAVFDREPLAVPYNLGDSTAADESVYGRAAISLLALAGGSATRREVFALAMNPCFLAAAGIEREDALVWLKWADELGVYRGVDQADKRARQYLDSPLYTWQHAFQRLRLGRMMEASPEADPGAPAWHNLVPYADLETQDRDRLNAFCGQLETLFARLEPLRHCTQTGRAWRLALSALLDAFLAPPPDRPAEAQVRQLLGERLLALDALDELALAMGADTPLFAADGAALDLALVTEAVREALGAIPSRHGAYLSGGVNISSLRPMRPIPFKITYILGLGEGCFPGYPDYSSLDLRSRYRRVGDITKPEENQYLFLEAFMSARHKLYLSYVNQELAKEEPLHPCTVVNQLLGLLRRSLPEGAFELAKVPLTGNSLTYLGEMPPHADAVTNYSVADRLLALAEVERQGQEVPGLAAAIARLMLRQPLPAAASEPPSGIVEMPLRELARFLENPIEAALRYRLHLFDEEVDERMLAEHEPFATGFPDRHRIVREVLMAVARTDRQAAAAPVETARRIMGSYYADLHRRGRTPDGPYAQLDLQTFEDQVETRVAGGAKLKATDSLGALLQRLATGTAYPEVAIGDPVGRQPPSLTLPPIRLPVTVGGQPVEVRLSGSLALCWRVPPASSLEIVAIGNTGPGPLPPRQIFTAFLTCLALKAGDPAHRDFIGEAPFTLHYAYGTGLRSYRYEVSAGAAAELLSELASGLLGDEAFDLLPYEVLAQSSLSPNPWRDIEVNGIDRRLFPARLSDACADELENPRPRWYPPDLVRLLPGRVPADAWDKAVRRFRLLREEADT